MIQESDLARAAAHLVSTERTYRLMDSYRGNLPADQEYDLGLRIDWQWGSSTDGYKEVQQAVRKAVHRRVRMLIEEAVAEAKRDLFDAQRALKAAA